ncbi:MAG TPA: MBL fold metallo-hydrolase [Flavisolibacter sp.]|nr:MBL fold metallo-hydrolase [Flavisolibacter sp.]
MIENDNESISNALQSGPLQPQPTPPLGGRGAVPLSEGSFTIDKSKLFVPFDEEKHVLTDRPVGSLLVEIQPFLVVTSKDVLLLDTGLGFNNATGKLQIHENIRRAGFEPEQVTKVLLTHLHKDHAGGIANPPAQHFGGGDVMNFPHAKYYLQKRELDFAWQKGFPSFVPDEIEPLLHSHQVEFLHDDKGVIDDYIFYEHTGGHSPHHQVFWIKDGNETIFFGGDDAPQLQQMKVRYKTKYDFDPGKAMQLRQLWWEQGNKEGWTFLFYHDIKTPMYKGPIE